jgi:hypothetical protein
MKLTQTVSVFCLSNSAFTDLNYIRWGCVSLIVNQNAEPVLNPPRMRTRSIRTQCGRVKTQAHAFRRAVCVRSLITLLVAAM